MQQHQIWQSGGRIEHWHDARRHRLAGDDKRKHDKHDDRQGVQGIDARQALLQKAKVIVSRHDRAPVRMHEHEAGQREEEVDTKTQIAERGHMRLPAHDVGIDRAVMQHDPERRDEAERVERDVAAGRLRMHAGQGRPAWLRPGKWPAAARQQRTAIRAAAAGLPSAACHSRFWRISARCAGPCSCGHGASARVLRRNARLPSAP